MLHWMTTMVFEPEAVDGTRMLVRGCACGRIFIDWANVNGATSDEIVRHIKEDPDD